MSKLRYFNGRLLEHPSYGRSLHGYISAHSKAEAVRLVQPTEFAFNHHELTNYWSECWGTPAEQALGFPDRPSFWASDRRDRVWHLISLMHEGKVYAGPELLKLFLQCLPKS